MRQYISLHHILVALWSVALSFLVLAFIGATSFLSNLIGRAPISVVVEISFFALSGIFAVLLWRFLPQPRKLWIKICAFLPPIFILIFLL